MEGSSNPSHSAREEGRPRPTDEKIQSYGWDGCQEVIEEGLLSRDRWKGSQTMPCDNSKCTMGNGQIRPGEKYAISGFRKNCDYRTLRTHADEKCEKLINPSGQSAIIESLRYLRALEPRQVWRFEQKALFGGEPYNGWWNCNIPSCRYPIQKTQDRVYFWNGSQDPRGEGDPGESVVGLHMHCQEKAFPNWNSPQLTNLFRLGRSQNNQHEIQSVLSNLCSMDRAMIGVEESQEPYTSFWMNTRLDLYPRHYCEAPTCSQPSRIFKGGESVATLWDNSGGEGIEDVDPRCCVTVHPACLSDVLPESTVNAPLVPVDPTKMATDRRRYSTGQFTDPFFG